MYPSHFEKKLANIIFIPIEINLLNGRIIIIQVGKYTTAKDVCMEMKNQIGLRSSLDFKLFLCFSEEDEILIDDEEFMCQVLDLDQHLFEKEIKKGICKDFRRFLIF